MAQSTPVDEVFYGGAAGGGKTDLLLGVALTQHKRSIIFRRMFPELRAIVDRSRELLIGTPAVYNDTKHYWRDIPGGRTLEFGAVEYEKDKVKYQGRPHDLKGFDELPEFTEEQYDFLMAWLRTAEDGQRCRALSAGNPPTNVEGEWVIKRWRAWLDPTAGNRAEHGEPRWYIRHKGEDIEVDGPKTVKIDGAELTPRSRTFIPAFLSDNPALRDSGYASVLQGLPEPLRTILLEGRFDLAREDDPWQVIPTAWIHEAQELWKTLELGPLTGLGVDVSRGGKDKTILAPVHGNAIGALIKHEGKEARTGDIVAQWSMDAAGGKNIPIGIDVIGCGTSPFDTLIRRGYAAIPVNFAEGSEATDKTGELPMRNKRAEYWWQAREALDPKNAIRVALPPDRELEGDLAAPKWKITQGGVLIESKEDIKKRIQRSTDCGDAVVIAMHERRASVNLAKEVRMGGQVDSGNKRTTAVLTSGGNVW